jgi:pimeloyl-ACP methyl ester carboxylesterase
MIKMIRKKSLKILLVIVIIQIACLNLNSIAKTTQYENPNYENCKYSLVGENIKQINVTFNSSGYKLYSEIYYPINNSISYPAVIFCEGLGGFVNAYNWVPKKLAEEGYVTMIFDPPGQGISEGIFPILGYYFQNINLYLRLFLIFEGINHYFFRKWVTATSDAITYLLEESSVKNIINHSKIGLIGHSLGGITVTETSIIDNRIDAVVALSQGNPLIIKNVKIPIQFQAGGFDLATHSVPIIIRCYNKVDSPKELIAIKHGTHFGFTTALNQLNPCPSWQKEVSFLYLLGWFDYFLKDKSEGYDIITSGNDYLSNVIDSKYNFGEGDIILK